jgi:hypothetical protein
MDHATRTVLAQRQVHGAPGEVPGFRPLLAELDLAGVVVTADALQTRREAAEFLVTVKQAHYLFTVKANQPTLLDRCAHLPWHNVPVLDRTRDRAHGRVELRTLKAVTCRVHLPTRRAGHPGHAQDPPPSEPAMADRNRLRDHQPRLRPGQPCPARRPHPRALDNRERPALRAGCDLRRGRLPGPGWHRPAGHGVPAQPRDRRAQPRPAGQPRHRLTPPRSRPHTTARHPRNNLRMKRTWRDNAGALHVGDARRRS